MGFVVVADRHRQHPAGLAGGDVVEGEQVGAFPHRGVGTFSLPEVAGVRPGPQVAGTVYGDAVAEGDHHHPRPGRFVPENLRIAEVLAALVGDDGVAVVAFPGATAIGAVRQGLRLPALGGGVDRDHSAARNQAGGVGAVVDAAAGHRQAEGVVFEGGAQTFPAHHVGADGVRPGAVLLMEQVVFALMEDQTVGVGQVPAGGGVVVHRSEGIGLGRGLRGDVGRGGR